MRPPRWLGAAFVVAERRSEHPLIELSLVRVPAVAGSLFALVSIQLAVLGLTVYLMLYLQYVLDYSALVAALLFLPTVLGTPLFSPLTGRWTDRYGAHAMVAGGLALAAVALAAIGLLADERSVIVMLPAFIAFGLARPLIFTPASTAAVGAIPERARGLASGLVTAAREVGAVTGVAVSTAIVTAVELGRRDDVVGDLEPTLGHVGDPALDSVLAEGSQGRALLDRLPAGARSAAENAVNEAFSVGFEVAMVSLAGLLAVAAAVALVLIRRRDA